MVVICVESLKVLVRMLTNSAHVGLFGKQRLVFFWGYAKLFFEVSVISSFSSIVRPRIGLVACSLLG